MVLRTLNENLSETSDAVPAPKSSDKADVVSTKDSQESGGTPTPYKRFVAGNARQSGKTQAEISLFVCFFFFNYIQRGK